MTASSHPLAGKIAIVTGASRGLGRAIALALVDAGACVVGTANRSIAELEAVAAERHGRIIPSRVDSADRAACVRLVAETERDLGHVDILVNNAGLGIIHVRRDYPHNPTPFWECPGEMWDRMLQVNLSGAFYLAAATAPQMKAAGWGRIINIGTRRRTMVLPSFSPYGASKAGLEAASVVWAKDLAGTGVTVNVLLPGGMADTTLVPDAHRRSSETHAGLMSPDIMAEPVVWLASAASDGVTGRRVVASKWAAGLAAAVSDAGWGVGGHPTDDD